MRTAGTSFTESHPRVRDHDRPSRLPGRRPDALAFYQSAFGGQMMMATYSQVGVPQDSADPHQAVFAPVDPSSPDAEHLAFGMLAAENGFRLAAYDVFGASGGGLAAAGLPDSSTRGSGLTTTESSFLLLNSETLEEATSLWNAFSAGGTVIQALAPADWAPAYGMLTDRFGVTWIFGIAPTA